MTALAIPSEEKLMKDSVAIFDVVFHHIQNVSVADAYFRHPFIVLGGPPEDMLSLALYKQPFCLTLKSCDSYRMLSTPISGQFLFFCCFYLLLSNIVSDQHLVWCS